eukprot:UN28910
MNGKKQTPMTMSPLAQPNNAVHNVNSGIGQPQQQVFQQQSAPPYQNVRPPPGSANLGQTQQNRSVSRSRGPPLHQSNPYDIDTSQRMREKPSYGDLDNRAPPNTHEQVAICRTPPRSASPHNSDQRSFYPPLEMPHSPRYQTKPSHPTRGGHSSLGQQRSPYGHGPPTRSPYGNQGHH